jgi:hypothetical protein
MGNAYTIIIFAKPEEKRPHGRPSTDRRIMDLTETRWEDYEWIHLV